MHPLLIPVAIIAGSLGFVAGSKHQQKVSKSFEDLAESYRRTLLAHDIPVPPSTRR